VLPFSDMSPTKDQEYLCEGMAEEIMNTLVRIDGIRVASRTSAFRARRDGGDLPAIARALSVGHVLEGSVRTSGSRLRVTAQLTDVASGYQLWSERFDREAADVFAIQDEIAAGVLEAVKARLAPGAPTIHARPQVRNLEAYRSYLKGRHLRYAKQDHGGAIRAFEEAIRLDPTHAPSWTALAESPALSALFSAIPAREACGREKGPGDRGRTGGRVGSWSAPGRPIRSPPFPTCSPDTRCCAVGGHRKPAVMPRTRFPSRRRTPRPCFAQAWRRSPWGNSRKASRLRST
jgi:TolB-like protein